MKIPSNSKINTGLKYVNINSEINVYHIKKGKNVFFLLIYPIVVKIASNWQISR